MSRVFNFSAPQPLWDALKAISTESGVPISRIIRDALAEWAQNRGFILPGARAAR
jgi:hypothetical protein